MAAPDRIDLLLATLNATDVGSLDSILDKIRLVEAQLRAMEQVALADRAAAAAEALLRGEVTEFKRARAFLQAKIGHLR